MKNAVIFFRDKTVIEVNDLVKISVIDSYGSKSITQFDDFVFYPDSKYFFSGSEAVSVSGNDILYVQFF